MFTMKKWKHSSLYYECSDLCHITSLLKVSHIFKVYQIWPVYLKFILFLFVPCFQRPLQEVLSVDKLWISFRAIFLQVLIICSYKRFGFVGTEWHSIVGGRKAASTAVHLNMKETSFSVLIRAKFIFTYKKCKSVKHLLTSLECTYFIATSVLMEQNWGDISFLKTQNIGVKFYSVADVYFVNKTVVCVIATIVNWYF